MTPELHPHEPEESPDYAELVAFFGHIAYIIPGLRPVLADHLREADGEMLPHLLMTDVLEWVCRESERGMSAEAPVLFGALDRGYTDGSHAMRDLMVIAFLEHIPGFAGTVPDPTGVGPKVRAAMGPLMSAVLAEIESWRHDPSTRPRPTR
ncbi:MAG: hypothetical protein CVT64_05165 [Actinobacteria bacterium HGW-Actinobacteria-4]|nr:MAG: hypothetical protein CVT64_05165 [Actinobacteria bacterium HGW-Actinobacteria-4]